jgi:DNA replication factor GINS
LYNELYEAWKREAESVELEKLQPDFYSRVAGYVKKLKEEGRMLDKKTVKAKLLRVEMRNVKRMVRELIQTRYEKLVRKTIKGETLTSDVFTAEEEKIYGGVSLLTEAHQGFIKHILHGNLPNQDARIRHKRAVLRFLKTVPAIVGSDMKTYGPFQAEDVAALPIENAKILVKRGVAEKAEV